MIVVFPAAESPTTPSRTGRAISGPRCAFAGARGRPSRAPELLRWTGSRRQPSLALGGIVLAAAGAALEDAALAGCPRARSPLQLGVVDLAPRPRPAGSPGASVRGRARCGCCGRWRSGAASSGLFDVVFRRPRLAPAPNSYPCRSSISSGDLDELWRVSNRGSRRGGRRASPFPGLERKKSSMRSLISGEHHHQLVAIVLHHLEQDLDRLLAVVPLVLGPMQVVGLVDEQDAAEGALQHLLGLRRRVARRTGRRGRRG